MSRRDRVYERAFLIALLDEHGPQLTTQGFMHYLDNTSMENDQVWTILADLRQLEREGVIASDSAPHYPNERTLWRITDEWTWRTTAENLCDKYDNDDPEVVFAVIAALSKRNLALAEAIAKGE